MHSPEVRVHCGEGVAGRLPRNGSRVALDVGGRLVKYAHISTERPVVLARPRGVFLAEVRVRAFVPEVRALRQDKEQRWRLRGYLQAACTAGTLMVPQL